MHVRDNLHGMGTECAVETDRLGDLAGRSRWMSHRFERMAVGAEIRALDHHFFFGP